MSDRFWYWALERLGATQEWIYETRLQRRVWRSFDNTVRALDELDDEHLGNILNKLMREGQADRAIFPFLVEEARTRKTRDRRLKRARAAAEEVLRARQR